MKASKQLSKLFPFCTLPAYFNQEWKIRDRKGTPKNFCDKDFAELSGELSGAIASKNPLFYWVVPSNCSENSLARSCDSLAFVFDPREKLTRSSLKGVSNRALFALKNERFAISFLLLGI